MLQQNPIAVKLAPLLAEYLYTNKQLDLPGIGTFRIDTSHVQEQEDRKQASPVTILFQNDPSIKEVPDLISFIASKSGKMKALATSDVESHVELINQFANIGKPFEMEGIGSLAKLRSGKYEFIQEKISSEKLKEYSSKETNSTTYAEEPSDEFKTLRQRRKMKPGKLLLIFFIIAGIGIAAWVGYKIYQKKVSKNDNSLATEQKKDETAPMMTDSSQIIKQTDTTKQVDSVAVQKPVAPEGTYKFIVEEANKERALLRYNSLKSWGLVIQMETADSAFFKLFFRLPSSVSDTAKVMDSLRILYTPVWSKSYVEK